MDKISGIYKIVNGYNQKFYIGQSVNIQHRWYQHLGDLRTNRHHCKALQKDWNYYREKAFSFSIIEQAPTHLLNDLEKEYISSYNNDRLYNFSMKDHPWKREYGLPKIIFPTLLKIDSDGVELPLIYCPNCNLEKLSNSFIATSIYCLECRELIADELDNEDFVLEGMGTAHYETPVTKYKITDQNV